VSDRSTPRAVGGVLLALAIAGAAVWGVTARLARPFTVAGPSMAPALQHGERVIVDLRALRGRDPAPGEIVLFRGPDGGPWVKRVSRVDQATSDDRCVWVEGDDPDNSTDSRTLGPIPRSSLIGVVTWRYWPLSRAGPISTSGSRSTGRPPGR